MHFNLKKNPNLLTNLRLSFPVRHHQGEPDVFEYFDLSNRRNDRAADSGDVANFSAQKL